jgi:hypothetical protein
MMLVAWRANENAIHPFFVSRDKTLPNVQVKPGCKIFGFFSTPEAYTKWRDEKVSNKEWNDYELIFKEHELRFYLDIDFNASKFKKYSKWKIQKDMWTSL